MILFSLPRGRVAVPGGSALLSALITIRYNVRSARNLIYINALISEAGPCAKWTRSGVWGEGGGEADKYCEELTLLYLLKSPC